MRALLGVGANLKDPAEQVRLALAAMDQVGIVVEACSRLVKSPAVGGPPGQPEYVNAAVVVHPSEGMESFVHQLQGIEQRLGRERREHWGPRAIDLDVLLVADHVVAERDLQVPHPRMAFRPFVLGPAAEIAASWHHPIFGVTVGELWHRLRSTPRVVAIDGHPHTNAHGAEWVAAVAKQGWKCVGLEDLSKQPALLPRLAVRYVDPDSSAMPVESASSAGRAIPTIFVEPADLNPPKISDIVALILGTETPLTWLSDTVR